MAHFVDKAAKLLIAFGVILNSKASDNETALYLSDEVAIQLTATNNNNIPTDYSTPVSVAYVTEVAETTTKITLMVTVQPGSDTSKETDDITTTVEPTKRTGKSRGFPSAPHYHLPDSRWGPFFEEGSETQNVTTRVGSTVLLDCRIGLLQDKMVTWLHHKDNSIHLLTVGKSAYSRDERITLSFRYPNNFRLEIVYVTRRDEGLYECQVSTHPPKVKRTYLKVTVPEIKIVDESGHKVVERYFKAGSALELTCIATNIGVPEEEPPMVWRHGESILSNGISYNVSDSTDMAISTLTLTPLVRRHSGNYTCTVGTLATATVNVQVLNGELPAAVHDGNSVPAGTVPNIAIVLFAVILAVRRR